MNSINNLTQRFGDVYSNFKSDNQYNLRTELPIIEHTQYDLFSCKKHKIKEFPKSDILDMKLGEIDTRPDFSIPTKLTLADQIGQAVVREKNRDEYEKLLLENQARDIEQYMAQNYADYRVPEKDLTHNINDKGQIMEIVPEYSLMDTEKNKEEPTIQKKKGRGKGKKTVLKELEVSTSMPQVPLMDPGNEEVGNSSKKLKE